MIPRGHATTKHPKPCAFPLYTQPHPACMHVRMRVVIGLHTSIVIMFTVRFRMLDVHQTAVLCTTCYGSRCTALTHNTAQVIHQTAVQCTTCCGSLFHSTLTRGNTGDTSDCCASSWCLQRPPCSLYRLLSSPPQLCLGKPHPQSAPAYIHTGKTELKHELCTTAASACTVCEEDLAPKSTSAEQGHAQTP